MAAKTYLVEIAGQTKGPFPFKELMSQYLRREITWDTKVCVAGGQEWQPFAIIKDATRKQQRARLSCVSAALLLAAFVSYMEVWRPNYEFWPKSLQRLKDEKHASFIEAENIIRLKWLVNSVPFTEEELQSAAEKAGGRDSYDKYISQYEILAKAEQDRQTLGGWLTFLCSFLSVGVLLHALRVRELEPPPLLRDAPPLITSQPPPVPIPQTPPVPIPSKERKREPKCLCDHCQTRIAFPESMEGQMVACPSCGQQTTLIDQNDQKQICEHCRGRIAYPSDFAGKTLQCPHCGATTVLGQMSRASAAPIPVLETNSGESTAKYPNPEPSICKPTLQTLGKASKRIISAKVGTAALCLAALSVVFLLYTKSPPAQSVPKADAPRKQFLAYKAQAEKGNAEAQFKLGLCYDDGNGVVKDDVEAVKWYRKAADQNYAKAQHNLGICYDHGQGVEKDNAEAVKWFRKAANQNFASAQVGLGYCYRNGVGVVKDHVEAVKWYRKAADQNDAIAQSILGTCYYFGQGVEKDYAEAVRWYRRAADQNDASAQASLGRCYDDGKGVEKDYVEAVRWHRKAADQNDASAQFYLGTSYDQGKGVKKDAVEAYAWFSLAGSKTSKLIPPLLSIMETQMSPQQIADAQKRTKELRAMIDATPKSGGK